MKRSPIKRKTPLRNGLPKTGRSKLGKPIPLAVRRAVKERSGGCCEACLLPMSVSHLHHRLLRSRGGEHTTFNLIAVHPLCHAWIHEYPAVATAMGLMVAGGDDPALVGIRGLISWPSDGAA